MGPPLGDFVLEIKGKEAAAAFPQKRKAEGAEGEKKKEGGGEGRRRKRRKQVGRKRVGPRRER